MSEKYQLHIGHALEVLKTMPDESVQCCVTSPPYWGLRQYDIPDTIFGGLPKCDHQWDDHIKIHKGGPQGSTGEMITRSVSQQYERTKDIIAGTFCQNCGAWKGQLGLEPTPELYVYHIVEIFREVLRVLRSDGTLWLNLGDCYATGAGKVGDCPGGGEQGSRWRDPTTKGYLGDRAWDQKNYKAIGPTIQPNRMPILGLKPKDLVGIPWRVAFALQADGWWLRSDIIWHKPNPMPGSYKDRPTTSHEYIFLLSKSARYYYDHEAIKEPVTGNAHPRGNGVNPKCKVPNGWDTSKGTGGHGKIHKSGRTSGTRYKVKQNESFSASVTDLVDSRNKRSVWTVSTHPYPEAHFATFPPKLIEPCVLAGCPEGGTVLYPFAGSGTTGEVALKHFRKFIGIDLGDGYINDMARPRVEAEASRYKDQDLFDTPL